MEQQNTNGIAKQLSLKDLTTQPDEKTDVASNGSDTLKSNKRDEDGARRTIIVERKNGVFGFTLQTYGIHYKKEQEIELITYVETVDSEGSAAAAGMREGDVIVSINGIDVQTADHATVVSTIAACNTRMRMVVSFEDCVRKVEVHLKYIDLQRMLQEKIKEIEQLSIKELQLLNVNWKSHSLPAPKKKVSKELAQTVQVDINSEQRQALSTENVTGKQKLPNSNLPIYFSNISNECQHCTLINHKICATDLLVNISSPKSRIVLKNVKTGDSSDKKLKYKQTKKKSQSIKHNGPLYDSVISDNNQDSNSLDAYDLASPCCNPQCVPYSKKRFVSKQHSTGSVRSQGHSDKSTNTDTKSVKSERHHRSKKKSSSSHTTTHRSVSLFESLKPCGGQINDSKKEQYDYNNSLSSDSLFWDGNVVTEAKSSAGKSCRFAGMNLKPKSWDNLTTKSFGGYGFGYGYLDKSNKISSGSRSKSHHRSNKKDSCQSQLVDSSTCESRCKHVSYRVYYSPKKSTENLLEKSNYCQGYTMCDCMNSGDYNQKVSDTSRAAYLQNRYPCYYLIKKDDRSNSILTRL